MKTAMITAIVVGTGMFSCVRKDGANSGGGTTGSGLASVNINQPKLKEAMKASLSDADKTKVYSSLVYQISIKAQKSADGKADDCDTGATASSFDSEILSLDKSAGDTVKVKKGCNYLVSMKYGMKSEDGKSIKTIMLQSWDDKDPSKLSKEELQKPKPTASVNLYVTVAGQPYWDISVIQTPDSDSDVSVNPTLAAKKFGMKADKVSITYGQMGKLIASATLTPVKAVTQDMHCALTMNIEYANGTSPSEYIFAFAGGSAAKSVFKFDANMAGATIVDFSGQFATDASFNGQSVTKGQVFTAFCAADEAAALAKVNECFPAPLPGPNMPTRTHCDSDNMIVQ